MGFFNERLMKIFLPILMLTLGLNGCASITGTRNQPVSVTATHEGKPITGAFCNLVNDKGSWHATTPGSVVIQKAYGDMSITCKKDDLYSGSSIFKSANEGAVWGNVLAGGLIGYAVDASSGAGFSYPPTMNIELMKLITPTEIPSKKEKK